MTSLSVEHNGQAVSIRRGEAFTVTLAGNPTTGYQWTTLPVEGVEVSHEYHSSAPPGSKICGAGGAYVFTVKTNGESKSFVLEAHYKRSWEKNPPAETFTVTVNLED